MSSYDDDCEISNLVTKIRDREDEEKARADKYELWYKNERDKFHWDHFVFGAIVSPIGLMIGFLLIYVISHMR